MKVTVHLVSRYRPDGLRRTIESFLKVPTTKAELRFLVRIDQDDAETIARLPEIVALGDVRVIIGPPHGYNGQKWYRWEMYLMDFEADWFWHFDDDATLHESSVGWDEKLAEVPKQQFIAQPEIDQLGGSSYKDHVNHPLFIVPNHWWNYAGLNGLDEPCDYFILQEFRKMHWANWFLKGVHTVHVRKTDKLMIEQGRRE